ncbi:MULTISPECIES: uroporphyrinogen-III synthase [unclassified Salinibacterium]|uniref:uroporphyrinogen-III synthase n=1 Tax=unclassified Salinibacterium TaxID=2632331 RepID=UPI001F0CF8DA|nr:MULTISPECIES: uroporphyrinogen-III synthase [unclassified Salinibacterium]
MLIPRGGEFGDRLAAGVRALGGVPLVAPLIDFGEPDDRRPLEDAIARLAAGAYDWLVVTSATTAEALGEVLAALPSTTRVAAVGPATAAALEARGAEVHLTPANDHSALGLLAEWPDDSGRVLLPQSEIAAETLEAGLRDRGLTLDVVTAYRTVAVELDPAMRKTVRAGVIDAILLTSGSTARHLAAQCAPLPEGIQVVCIGESTARAATASGLRVDAIAERSEGESLIDALVGLTA